jgi:hypothetical protein
MICPTTEDPKEKHIEAEEEVQEEEPLIQFYIRKFIHQYYKINSFQLSDKSMPS